METILSGSLGLLSVYWSQQGSLPAPSVCRQVPQVSTAFSSVAAGNDFRQPRTTASGQTVQPPPLTTDGPVQDQGYMALPLTSFQGKIADSAGRAQVLVVYHYYESLTTCEEDEEIQLIRSNFLSFLR